MLTTADPAGAQHTASVTAHHPAASAGEPGTAARAGGNGVSARLSIVGGSRAGETFLLKRDVVVIGRGANPAAYDIVLDDPTVSRPHAQLVREGDSYVLHDLGSANGTALNYRRLTSPRPLTDGDLIQVGRTVLIYRTLAGLAAEPPGMAADAPGSSGRVLTFFRLKGGVGATTLAVNTALRLRQLTQEPVLLLDLSVEQACMGVHFDIQATRGLDALARLRTPPPELLPEIVIHHATGLAILPAATSPETAELITGEFLAHVLPALKARYRWIVVDTTPTFSDLNLSVLDRTDVLVVVATPDLATIKTTQACLNVCKSVLPESCERRLLINNLYPRAQLGQEDVIDMLGEPVAHVVPYSEDVLRAIDRGVPLALHPARHPVVQAIDGLVAAVAHVEAPPLTITQRGSFWSRQRGLLRR